MGLTSNCEIAILASLFLTTGCGCPNLGQVPAHASLVATSDEHLEGDAPSDGYVYLAHSGQAVMWESHVAQGDKVEVAVADSEAYINGQRIHNFRIEKHGEYRLYFLGGTSGPSPSPSPPPSSSAAPVAAAPTRRYSIPFRYEERSEGYQIDEQRNFHVVSRRRNAMIVDAVIDGHQLPMIVDTGAEMTLINGIASGGTQVQGFGVFGSGTATLVQVQTIIVGEIAAGPRTVEVASLNPRFYSLLGWDFFAPFAAVHIDNAHHLIEVEAQ